MAKIKNVLTLADLVLLKVISQHPNLRKQDLWTPKGGLWNKALKLLVESGRCGYVTSDHRFASSIATLRFCEMLGEVGYDVTEEGVRVLQSLPRQMKQWPLLVPLWYTKFPDWNAATYYKEK